MKREKYGCIYGTNLKMYIQKLRNILRVSIIIKVHVIQHINARPFATLITRSKPLFSLITIFVYISRFTFIKKFHTRCKRISDNSHSLLRATMRRPKNDTLRWNIHYRDETTAETNEPCPTTIDPFPLRITRIHLVRFQLCSHISDRWVRCTNCQQFDRSRHDIRCGKINTSCDRALIISYLEI